MVRLLESVTSQWVLRLLGASYPWLLRGMFDLTYFT